jgi:hypothetical protein
MITRRRTVGAGWTVVPVLAALVMSLLPAAPATAADWRGPNELAAKVFISPAVIVSARDGSSTAVWSQDDALGRERIFLRRITPAGRLRPPVVVSAPGPYPASFDVAVDDDGDAVVVWQVRAPYPVQWQILARRVSRTGERGPIVRVSDEAENSGRPFVALTPSGVATIVFDRGVPTSEDNTVVRRLRLNSSLSRPTYLPWTYILEKPASSRSGHVAFVMSPTVDRRGFVARVDPDGDVHVRRLTGDLPGNDGDASVDLDRRGNAYVAVSRADGSRAWVRVWRVGGRLERARRITPEGHAADRVQLRTDLTGDATVLWGDYRGDGSGFSLRARSWRGDRLGPVVRLGRMDGPETPSGGELPSWSIDVDDDGDGVLAWEVWSDDLVDTFVRTRVVKRDGSFGQLRDLGEGAAPVVAVAPGGAARLTMWSDVRDETQLLLWTRD